MFFFSFFAYDFLLYSIPLVNKCDDLNLGVQTMMCFSINLMKIDSSFFFVFFFLGYIHIYWLTLPYKWHFERITLTANIITFQLMSGIRLNCHLLFANFPQLISFLFHSKKSIFILYTETLYRDNYLFKWLFWCLSFGCSLSWEGILF